MILCALRMRSVILRNDLKMKVFICPDNLRLHARIYNSCLVILAPATQAIFPNFLLKFLKETSPRKYCLLAITINGHTEALSTNLLVSHTDLNIITCSFRKINSTTRKYCSMSFIWMVIQQFFFFNSKLIS